MRSIMGERWDIKVPNIWGLHWLLQTMNKFKLNQILIIFNRNDSNYYFFCFKGNLKLMQTDMLKSTPLEIKSWLYQTHWIKVVFLFQQKKQREGNLTFEVKYYMCHTISLFRQSYLRLLRQYARAFVTHKALLYMLQLNQEASN